jgi:YegS/Rv2252/BmrU family lipid kinase
MMRVGVVVNPTSEESVLNQVRQGLEMRAAEIVWEETTEGDPGVGQARALVERGVDIVLAVGGDGTVRACVEGLADTDVSLGVIPLGTGNLLARNLDIPLDIDEAIEVALTGRSEVLDAGVINGEVFTVIAGTGFDAAIMESTESEMKSRIGSLAYVIEGIRHIADAPISAEIEIDGAEAVKGKWATILIGNLGRLQGGVDLFPDAFSRDGRLDMLALSAETTMEALAAGYAAVTHNDDHSQIFRAAGKSFRIQLDRPAPYEMDGEPRPDSTSLEVEVAPDRLNVRVPRSDR